MPPASRNWLIWQPAFAPAFANSTGFSAEWSIATGAGGARQWAYKGHPLYTYAYDSEGHGGQLLGDTYGSIWGPPIKGWQVAVAKAAPRHPSEVTVQQLPGTWEQFNTPLPGTVYADRQGFTLYTVHCRRGRDSVTCDDVGDDPRYWLSFCGGEEQCAQTWHPLLAPAQAHAVDGVWSVVLINPTHPFRRVEAGRGIRVWAYRGRPVFTYARDRLPGDFYGDDQSFAISGDGMQARPIPAYERYMTARPPVMALQR